VAAIAINERRVDQRGIDRLCFLHELFIKRRAGGRPLQLIGCDLAGLDLSGRDLTEADLTGSTLRDAKLVHTLFRRATLRSVNFDGADLGSADFERADMRAIRLTSVNLLAVGPDATSFRGANLSEARLARACLQAVDFTGAVLRDCVVDESDCRGAVFVGCDLSGVDVGRMVTGNSDFRATTGLSAAQNAALAARGAKIGRRIDHRSESFHALLAQHRLWIFSGGLQGARAMLIECDLSGLDLAGVILAAADLSYASFAGANLRNAVLAAAVVRGANFRRADLSGADLRGTAVAGAVIRGANVKGAQFGALPQVAAIVATPDIPALVETVGESMPVPRLNATRLGALAARRAGLEVRPAR
jgi:uncharacterized protein YjbI with pentapeptide repeats